MLQKNAAIVTAYQNLCERAENKTENQNQVDIFQLSPRGKFYSRRFRHK